MLNRLLELMRTFFLGAKPEPEATKFYELTPVMDYATIRTEPKTESADDGQLQKPTVYQVLRIERGGEYRTPNNGIGWRWVVIQTDRGIRYIASDWVDIMPYAEHEGEITVWRFATGGIAHCRTSTGVEFAIWIPAGTRMKEVGFSADYVDLEDANGAQFKASRYYVELAPGENEIDPVWQLGLTQYYLYMEMHKNDVRV